ncbi:Aspartate racemase [Fimbriimonas ginsengisoli Gsoil 348]|uniref:Aspartate racemase n=2 Tax=Fimbriimonas ginsengisoli TaxID=1005039 RepID=A0A068NUV9_FIMGI|nr:Aspartate racemase [Fimbriimonas ginsengisoli Gsoil 348]
MGRYRHPEVSVHTPPFVDYVRCFDQGDWAAVGELMLASARKLTACGADFLICPDNTIHQAFSYMESRSPLPWLHIAEVVAESAQRRGFRRVGLMGTKWLVESEVYPERLAARDISYLRPSIEDRIETSRVIMEELVRGHFEPSSVARFQQVIQKFRDQGADAVILGCTEIPLIVDDTNSPLPTLDSTCLLAQAAVRRAIAAER